MRPEDQSVLVPFPAQRNPAWLKREAIVKATMRMTRVAAPRNQSGASSATDSGSVVRADRGRRRRHGGIFAHAGHCAPAAPVAEAGGLGERPSTEVPPSAFLMRLLPPTTATGVMGIAGRP